MSIRHRVRMKTQACRPRPRADAITKEEDKMSIRKIGLAGITHVIAIAAFIQPGTAGDFRIRKPDLARPPAQCASKSVHDIHFVMDGPNGTPYISLAISLPF